MLDDDCPATGGQQPISGQGGGGEDVGRLPLDALDWSGRLRRSAQRGGIERGSVQELAAELFERARSEGVSLVGPDERGPENCSPLSPPTASCGFRQSRSPRHAWRPAQPTRGCTASTTSPRASRAGLAPPTQWNCRTCSTFSMTSLEPVDWLSADCPVWMDVRWMDVSVARCRPKTAVSLSPRSERVTAFTTRGFPVCPAGLRRLLVACRSRPHDPGSWRSDRRRLPGAWVALPRSEHPADQRVAT